MGSTLPDLMPGIGSDATNKLCPFTPLASDPVGKVTPSKLKTLLKVGGGSSSLPDASSTLLMLLPCTSSCDPRKKEG